MKLTNMDLPRIGGESFQLKLDRDRIWMSTEDFIKLNEILLEAEKEFINKLLWDKDIKERSVTDY